MENDHEQDTPDADSAEAPEFDPKDIENDPAYNPEDDEHAKDLKGG